MLHSISTNAITHSRAWANGVVSCWEGVLCCCGTGCVTVNDQMTQGCCCAASGKCPSHRCGLPAFYQLYAQSMLVALGFLLPQHVFAEAFTYSDSFIPRQRARRCIRALAFPLISVMTVREGHSGTLFFFASFHLKLATSCNILQQMLKCSAKMCQGPPFTQSEITASLAATAKLQGTDPVTIAQTVQRCSDVT